MNPFSTNPSLTLPGRQHYGRYAIVLLLLPIILGVAKGFVTIPVDVEEVLFSILTITTLGVIYFFILWILEIIRFRGGIERPQNHSARTYVKYYILISLVVVGLDKIPFQLLLAHQFIIPALVISKLILSGIATYFMVFWIMEIIRLRGGIERPVNKTARKIFSIVWAVLIIIAILTQWMFATLFGFTL